MAARWTIKRDRNGEFVAIIRFSAADGGTDDAHVGAVGASRRQALARAAVLARQLTESPVFVAVAPPGTAAAIKAIHALATSKDVRKTLERYTGRGARRLARALKVW
jgi:hypothetical protein